MRNGQDSDRLWAFFFGDFGLLITVVPEDPLPGLYGIQGERASLLIHIRKKLAAGEMQPPYESRCHASGGE